MKCTAYTRILNFPQNAVEDLSDHIIVNCTGRIHKKDDPLTNNTSRPDFFLLYMTEGHLTVYFDKETFTLKPGMVLVYYPNTPYHQHFDGKGTISYYWIHFTGSHATELMERFQLTNKKILNIGVHSQIINLFQKVATEIMCREPDFVFATATYLQQILVTIKRFENPTASISAKKLKKSLEMLHNNYNKILSVHELAELEGLSDSRYRVLFRNVTGISPKQYLTDIRIRHACELLCQTTLKVSQIAPMVGYDDLLYFDRIFKKATNMTPTQYRDFYSEI